MEKEKLRVIYEELKRYDREHSMADKKRKQSIEESVRFYSQSFPGEVYADLNYNAASGLFRSGFFESDMSHCLRVLKERLNED